MTLTSFMLRVSLNDTITPETFVRMYNDLKKYILYVGGVKKIAYYDRKAVIAVLRSKREVAYIYFIPTFMTRTLDFIVDRDLEETKIIDGLRRVTKVEIWCDNRCGVCYERYMDTNILVIGDLAIVIDTEENGNNYPIFKTITKYIGINNELLRPM